MAAATIISVIAAISSSDDDSSNNGSASNAGDASGSYGEDGLLSLIVRELSARYLNGEVKILIDSDGEPSDDCDIEIATEKRGFSVLDGEIFQKIKGMINKA